MIHDFKLTPPGDKPIWMKTTGDLVRPGDQARLEHTDLVVDLKDGEVSQTRGRQITVWAFPFKGGFASALEIVTLQ